MTEPGGRLPLRKGGAWRKRWRYVGAYDERFMLCAADVEIGPVRETFWALWDRSGRELREHTRHVVPFLAGPEVELDGSAVRVRARGVSIDLELGPGREVECRSPASDGAWTWTRKLAGITSEGTVRIGPHEHHLRGHAVDDLSAGFHARRTSWMWSAGVGRSTDGRDVAWNLVSGINDPPAGSERAIWVDGVPAEPDPVEFDGLHGVRFADGSEMRFEAEATRANREGIPGVLVSDYEAPFGTFAGSLPGIELERGSGVMERHDAVW